MANVSHDLDLGAEQRLLEAGLSLHNGLKRTDRVRARRHLREALEALDVAINEVRLAIIDLDDRTHDFERRLRPH